MLDYFDAYLVGLTATPSKQTLGFFRQNLVMEYNHARAVAAGAKAYEEPQTFVTGDRFCSMLDPWGHRWAVLTRVEDVSPEEADRRSLGGRGSRRSHAASQLEQARGAEFDRLFLTFMIQHHRGAVAMVKELYASPGAAQDETVFKFADDVGVDQTTEIARMERMLAALPAGEPAS